MPLQDQNFQQGFERSSLCWVSSVFKRLQDAYPSLTISLLVAKPLVNHMKTLNFKVDASVLILLGKASDEKTPETKTLTRLLLLLPLG